MVARRRRNTVKALTPSLAVSNDASFYNAAIRRHRLRLLREERAASRLPRILLSGTSLIAMSLLVVCFAVASATSFAFDRFKAYAVGSGNIDAMVAALPSGGSRIYDRNGVLLYEYANAGLRRVITLDEVSPSMVQATISTEDANFWENNGLNTRGLVRAAVENLTPFRDEGWFEGSGGSSITQQLVKNIYFTPEERMERSIDRKIKESALALTITDSYSKQRILEWYLNSISYGGLYTGIEAAAQGYFGKPAAELTLGESALLAGIPQRPARYAPTVDLEASRARQSEVLGLMVRHGHITQAEADEAYAQELVFRKHELTIQAPHFVLGPVAQAIEDRFGPTALTEGGLTITTTLDLGLQQEAERILEDWIAKSEQLAGGHNGALYALDAASGQVLSYVGSRGYFRDDVAGRNDNIASLNSPGSTLKPFTYMTAFTKGWTTGTGVLDLPLTLKDAQTGKDFKPRNPIDSYQGIISVAKALGNSLNIPAVNTILFAGVNDTAQMYRRVGLSTVDGSTNAYGPALTVGGVDVTLADMVFAYSVLANNGAMVGEATLGDPKVSGRKVDPAVLLQVKSAQGEELYRYKEPVREQVIDPAFTYLVTSILSDGNNQCITFGVCGALSLKGRPAAIKTGTSEPFEDTKTLIGETWAVGYTPQLVVGTWFGNSDNTPMQRIYSTTVSWNVWRDFTALAHDYIKAPVTQFVRPPNVVDRTVCAPSGLVATEACPQNQRRPALAANVEGVKLLTDFWWKRMPDGSLRLEMPPALMASKEFAAWAYGSGLVPPPATPTPSPTPQPATPQPSSTPRPGTTPPASEPMVALVTPSSGSTVKGTVAVSGIASASGSAQLTVVLLSGDGTALTLATISGPISQQQATWARWDTKDVRDGNYALRVTVTDSTGKSAVAISSVRVNND